MIDILATVDPSLPWTESLPQLLSKKKKKPKAGTTTRSEDEQRKLPDIQYAIMSADFSRVHIRQVVRRDTFGWKRRAKNGKNTAKLYNDKKRQVEFMFVPMKPTFKVDEDGTTLDWFDRSIWCQGRNQRPVQFDNSTPLYLSPDGPPKNLSPSNRLVRATEEAKGARGERTTDGTTHTIISIDPGLAFFLAAFAVELGKRESKFLTVGSSGLKNEDKIAARIRTILVEFGLHAQISKAFTGTLDSDLPSSPNSSSQLFVIHAP
jgi:hypothetical protein